MPISGKYLSEVLGADIQRIEQVQGGDISQSFCLQTKEKQIFLKQNNALKYPEMFAREAEGLSAIRTSFSLCVPELIKVWEQENIQYLALEWLEKSAPTSAFMESFGIALANLHRVSGNGFGWHTNNYIGSLIQSNTFQSSWPEFYTVQRVMPLVKMLFDHGRFIKTDIKIAEICCDNFNNIFPGASPSLLHGDLWSGNFMTVYKPGALESTIAIFDPAVYFGHREMDIAMTLLFGGFSPLFYESYQNVFPLESGWKHRVSVCQLYPVLVHAVLFGGGYIGQARDILRQYS